MNIITLPIDQVTPYPGNPRINEQAVAPVAASIKEFGFQQPIVVDKNNVIIVGHTRFLAAKQLGLTEVPVVVAEDLTEDQAKAYRLADNRTNQNADWDWSLLGDELNELLQVTPELVPITGFDKEEVRKATTFETRGKREFEPQPKPDPMTTYGDVWVSENGEHSVLCTENTSDLFKSFLDGKQIDCIVTDPPYNISYSSGKGEVHNDTFANREAFIKFLTECFKLAATNLRAGGAVFTCGNEHCHYTNETALAAHNIPLKYELFWVKDRVVYSQNMNMMAFRKQHENIWVGWKTGAARRENPTVTGTALLLDDREDWTKFTKEQLLQRLILIHETFSTVREAPHEKDKLAVHPTIKPVALFVPLIRKSTLPGDTVCDIFAGSGVTAMACQETARKSISVELDPSYVDCILTRLYEHHGLDFTNQNGVKFSDLWLPEKARREAEDDGAGDDTTN